MRGTGVEMGYLRGKELVTQQMEMNIHYIH